MSHVLVTNDFPPRVGGIESYLWELWRRLPPERVTVLTNRVDGAAAFDSSQRYRIERTRSPVLLPTPGLARRVRSLAAEVGASVVLLDPALPLGLIGPRLGVPYALVLHGAGDVTVPGRIPVTRPLMARVVRGAVHLVAAGGYPASEARRAAGGTAPPVTVVPPGVDTVRFRPLSEDERRSARRGFGLPESGPLIVSVSRLVPRKGMDVLIDAAARLRLTHPDVRVAIGSDGRDRGRLERRIRRSSAPVVMLGRISDVDLPALYGCADVFAMLCRGNRWFGLEQEGFGIVFIEAAACGVPQVAGDSGGAAEAVIDGETGFVVREPRDPRAAAATLARLLDDAGLRRAMGERSRARVETDFAYDHLARRLDATLLALEQR